MQNIQPLISKQAATQKVCLSVVRWKLAGMHAADMLRRSLAIEKSS